MFKIGNAKLIKEDLAYFYEKYQIREMVTKSANGILFNGLRIKDQKKVILKVIPKDSCHRFGVLLDRNGLDRVAPIEFKIHHKASATCDRVCKMYDWFEMPKSFCLVLDYLNGFDLYHITTKYGALSEDLTRTLMLQIIESMQRLSRAGIAHRDIKDENIMVDLVSLEVTIIDFGCGIEFCKNDIFTTFSGTVEFYPPEWFHSQFYCPMKGTVWSLGCLLFTLLTGDVPYRTKDDIFINRRTTFSQPLLSSSAKEAIEQMLDIVPETRIPLSKLLSLQFFAEKSQAGTPSLSENYARGILPENLPRVIVP